MPEVSNEVLAERIDGFRELMAVQHADNQRRLEDQHKENSRRLDFIAAQTARTNGRVTKLERWQTAIIAGAAVILFLLRDSVINIIKSIF